MIRWREQCWHGRLTRLVSLAVLLSLVVVGCGRRKPPALQQGKAVYRNQNEGFRLAPPPGWNQQGRGEPTRADRKHECLLVKYKRLTEAKDAFFQVLVVEREDTDLETYLTNRPVDRNWQREGKSEPMEVNQLPALRQVFSGNWDKDKVRRELVAVQRGTRIYLFVGDFTVGDEAAARQIQEAVASVVWEGQPK